MQTVEDLEGFGVVELDAGGGSAFAFWGIAFVYREHAIFDPCFDYVSCLLDAFADRGQKAADPVLGAVVACPELVGFGSFPDFVEHGLDDGER